MDKSSEPAVATEAKETPHPLNRMLAVAAFPISALTGYWTASVTAHHASYNKAKGLGTFDDLSAIASSKGKADIQDALKGEITTEEFGQRVIKNTEAFRTPGFERMEKLGLQYSHDLKTFKNKWNFMSLESRQTALLNGLAVSGITIGAVLSMANSKTLTNMFSGKSKEWEPER